ncbi:MAG: RNA polymerase sigma factor [Phycisphaerae bacterium]
MTPEQALQAYAARHDAEAFRTLVEEYQGLVYSAASRLLKTREDIEDVSQQTFLKLAQRAGTIRENLAGWLHATAVTTALDRIRSDSTRRRHEDRLLVPKTDAPPAEWSELSAIIDEEIARLPPDARDLIVAHFLHGESHRAIADRTGVNQSTISRRMEQAVEKLRNRLTKRGFGGLGTGAAAFAGLPKAAVPARVTAELAKVGLTGAGATTAAIPLTFAIAAILAIAAATFVGIWLLRPGKPPTPVVAVPASAPAATPPATAPAIPPAYALAPGEELRRVSPPFPPERQALLKSAAHMVSDLKFVKGLVLYENNGKLVVGGTEGAAQTTEGFLRYTLRLHWFRYENLDQLPWSSSGVDWVVRGTLREEENVPQRLAAFAKIASADLGADVHFESHKVTRPCIVVKGKLRRQTWQNSNGVHTVMICLRKPTAADWERWKQREPGEWMNDFQDVGWILDAPFMPEKSSYVGEAFNILNDA